MADANAGLHFTGTQRLTPHIVVRGAAQAADWYKQALGAKELGQRIAAPGGKFMHIDLWFGDAAVMLADEFPEMNVLSPQSIGGTSVVLMLTADDVDALWQRAVSVYPAYLGQTSGYVYANQTETDVAACPSGYQPAGGGLDYKGANQGIGIGNIYALHASTAGWQGSTFAVTTYGLVPIMPTVWVMCLGFV